MVDQQIVEGCGVAAVAFAAGDQAGEAVVGSPFSVVMTGTLSTRTVSLLFEAEFEIVPAIESPAAGFADGKLFIA